MLAVLAILASPALAVEPDEMLTDPALELRARTLSADLRCPVCQNENIDESNAQLSRDLRIVLRERLVAGDSDDQAVDYLVRRYGEFILLKPTFTGANLALWLSAPILLGFALAVGWRAGRRRTAREQSPLSDAEAARIDEILNQ